MPNAKVLSEKEAVVAGLVETLKSSVSGVLVNYEGITVAEDTQLRNELRKAGVEYSVVKNTLVRRALDDAGMSELDDVLHGTTSLAVSKEDAIAPMRVINKFAKSINGDRFVIKAGFMDGKVLPLDDVIAMAELPSKETLIAQLLGMMLAPITSLAIVTKAIAEKGGVPAEKTEEAPVAEAAPAEEAPAAEAAPAETPAEAEAPAEPAAEAEAPAEAPETPAE